MLLFSFTYTGTTASAARWIWSVCGHTGLLSFLECHHWFAEKFGTCSSCGRRRGCDKQFMSKALMFKLLVVAGLKKLKCKFFSVCCNNSLCVRFLLLYILNSKSVFSETYSIPRWQGWMDGNWPLTAKGIRRRVDKQDQLLNANLSPARRFSSSHHLVFCRATCDTHIGMARVSYGHDVCLSVCL